MPSLAGRLRAETQTLHTEVERSPFMAALLRGRLGLPAYCLLMRNLHPIYAELESGLTAHQGAVSLAPLYFPRLWRTHSIAQDLECLWGDAWRTGLELLEPADRYRLRLRELTKNQPALLGAHAYVRYLGDLSGGQLLRGIVSRSLRLENGRGLSFFDFGNPQEAAGLAAALRHGLDTLTVGIDIEQALVSEAKAAFGMHAQLFESLAAAVKLPP